MVWGPPRGGMKKGKAAVHMGWRISLGAVTHSCPAAPFLFFFARTNQRYSIILFIQYSCIYNFSVFFIFGWGIFTFVPSIFGKISSFLFFSTLSASCLAQCGRVGPSWWIADALFSFLSLRCLRRESWRESMRTIWSRSDGLQLMLWKCFYFL